MEIEYRDIEGFTGYRVGNDGTVWTCRIPGHGNRFGNWRLMALGDGHNHYRLVGLTVNKRRITRYVHDLVLRAFMGPRPIGMQACHNPDPNPLNNAITNLRWDTPSGNNQDKVHHGTRQSGENNPRAKLRADQVIEIRHLTQNGASFRDVAAKFNVTSTLIRLIVQRKCWK